MEIVNISKEDIENKLVYLSNGFESNIYRDPENKDILLKIYYPGESLQNQYNKINLLGNMNIDGVSLPKQLLYCDDLFCGYTMEYKQGYYSAKVNKKDNTVKERYEQLLKLRSILDSLHSNGIIYGDLSTTNVLTRGKDVFLCDIVNSRVGNYSCDEKSIAMHDYLTGGGFEDLRLDYHMLNLFTIYYLNNIDYDDVLNYVETYLYNFFTKNDKNINIIGMSDNIKCLEICSSLLNPKIGNGELLLDFMDIERFKTNKSK